MIKNKPDRKSRVRTKLGARSGRPRLSIFVSNAHIYAQIIDDTKGVTLAAASDKSAKSQGKSAESAKKVGELIAKKSKEKKIFKVKFDRGGNKYHGRIKSLAEGARKGGLEF